MRWAWRRKRGKIWVSFEIRRLGNLRIIAKFTKFTKLSNHNLNQHHDLICCQSGVVVALTRDRADGTYLAYFPFALWTEASLMRHYHNKLDFLIEEVRCYLD